MELGVFNSSAVDVQVRHDPVKPGQKIKVPGYEGEVQVGILTHFLYKLEDSEETIEVATTRPETMLADTAVAVHPHDDR